MSDAARNASLYSVDSDKRAMRTGLGHGGGSEVDIPAQETEVTLCRPSYFIVSCYGAGDRMIVSVAPPGSPIPSGTREHGQFAHTGIMMPCLQPLCPVRYKIFAKIKTQYIF